MRTIIDKRYYTVKDLTKELPLTMYSVREYIKKGKIKSIRIGTRYYVSEQDLQEFLSSDKEK